MELLCLKVNDQYLKIKDNSYEFVSVQKASVYPIDQLDDLKFICSKFNESLTNLKIKKLIILEEDFNEN